MFFKKLLKNDYEIIRIIVKDNDFDTKSIAEKIGVSDKTVRNRMNKLLSYGAIKKNYIVDPSFFDHNLKIDFFLKVKHMHVEEVTNWILKNHKHNITYLGRHWGEDDISLQTVFKTTKDGDKFSSALRNNKNIEAFNMAVVPVVIKDIHNWRPHEENFRITEKGKNELANRRKSE